MADDTSNRGLANADEETRQRVSSMGGQAQPTEEKRKAGKKGGEHSHGGGGNS